MQVRKLLYKLGRTADMLRRKKISCKREFLKPEDEEGTGEWIRRPSCWRCLIG
jgi:hypothetical protein